MLENLFLPFVDFNFLSTIYNNVHCKLTFLLLKMDRPCKFKNGKRNWQHISIVSQTCQNIFLLFVQNINGLALYWRPNYVIETALTEEFLYVFVKKLNTE